MTTINETYDLLCMQLDEWYGKQPFEVIGKIFDIDLYEFVHDEKQLEHELKCLKVDWNYMSIDEKYFNYKQFRGIYDYL